MSYKRNTNTEKTNLMPICILAVLTAVVLIVMIAALRKKTEPIKGEFVPPAFEVNAVSGVPEVPAELGYSSPYREGMAYRFSVCGNVRMNGTQATVYMTNAAENEVYLKLRILDEKGNILGESGLLKPGEYVKDVELNQTLSAGTKIGLKIMSYEPETYMSVGSAVLNTSVGE